MPVWTTKHPAASLKAEAEKLGLEWHSLEGVEVRSFEDGTSLLVTHDTPDATKLAEHLLAIGMIEASG
jgi:ABC-type sulfate/molybdate transport systems ATPase subunit